MDIVPRSRFDKRYKITLGNGRVVESQGQDFAEAFDRLELDDLISREEARMPIQGFQESRPRTFVGFLKSVFRREAR